MKVMSPPLWIGLTPKDQGKRLDRLLQEALAPISRKEIKHGIDHGRVRIDGRPARMAGHLLHGHELIEVREVPRMEFLSDRLEPCRILLEDEHLVAVDKPAGLSMHAVETGDSHHLVALLRDRESTSHHPPSALLPPNALVGARPERKSFEPDPPALPGHASTGPYVVSRLDRETSGVVVLARTRETARALTLLFSSRAVHKVYRAIVHDFGADDGSGLPDQGEIDLPIGPIGRSRYGETRDGKPARTRFRLVSRGESLAVLEVEPETGRTHQIRVHLSAVGAPIVGDLLYGGRRRLNVQRCLLHAERLCFTHPVTREGIELCAPLPEDMLIALKAP